MLTNQYKNQFNIFIFLLGVALLIRGLLVMKYEYELTPIILFLSLFSISLLIHKLLKITVIQIGIGIISFLAILSGNIASLFIIMITICSAYLMGHRICLFFKILDIDSSIQFLLGIGIFGTLIGLGAHFPIAYPATYSLMLAAPFIGIRDPKFYFDKFSKLNQPEALTKSIPIYLLQIGIISFFIIYFLYSLLPELGFDALVYHLFIPAQVSSLHLWGFDVEKYIWAVFPLLGDWIFSLTYVLSGEVATRFINLFFILIGARLIYLLSQELNISKIGQLLSVAIYFSTPLTFAMGTTLYVESIWGAFFIAATLMIIRSLRWNSKTSNKNYILMSLMLGFSAAAKMATLVLSPLVLLATIFFTKILAKRNWLIAIISIFLFCLVGLIPNLTAWIKTKNPFFPILNNIFTSPLFPNFKFIPPHTVPIKWDLLFEITFHTGKFLESTAGGIGFHLILFSPIILLAALTHGKSEKKFLVLLTICIFGILSIFLTTSYVRYAYPLFTMLCLCTVASTEIIKPSKNILLVLRLSIVVVMILNLVFLNAATWNYRNFSYSAIFSKEKRTSYLLQMAPIRLAVEAVNQLNIDHSPVACFSHPLVAGLKAEALFPNWYNSKFQDEVLQIKDSRGMSMLLNKYKVKYIIIQDGSPVFNLSNNLMKILVESTNPIAEIGSGVMIRSTMK
jgi:hypothetical protein